MKLFYKLILSILALFLLLGGLWVGLPSVLEVVAKEQLSEAGFSKVEVSISDVTLQALTIDRLNFANNDYAVTMTGGVATYDLSRLIAGQLISIEIHEIQLHKAASAMSEGATLLPDPVFISSLLLTPWRQYNPADYMVLDKLLIFDEENKQTLAASINVSRQGEGVQADVLMQDGKGHEHSISLLAYEESLDLQWFSPDSTVENPVSLQIKPGIDGSGISGQADVNFSALTGIVPELGGLSGQMKAEFSYVSDQSSDNKTIKLTASVVDFAMADSAAKGILFEVDALLTEKDESFKLKFAPSPTVSMTGVSYGKDKIENIKVKLPKEIDVVAGWPVLTKNNAAEITVSNMMMDNIKIPEIAIRKITISDFKPEPDSEKVSIACVIGATLDMPLMIVDDVKIIASPFKATANCVGVNAQSWSLKAETQSVEIENDDFQVAFTNCKVTAKAAVATVDDGAMNKISGLATCQNKTSNGMVEARFIIDSSKKSGYVDYAFTGVKPDNEKPLISSLIKDWQQPFDIVSGKVAAKGRYSWWKNKNKQSRDKLALELNIEDAGGFYEGVLFSGMNYKDRFAVLPEFKSSNYSTINISDLDIGIPITSLRSEMLFKPSAKGPLPKVQLKSFDFSVLDGKIRGNGLNFDMNNDDHELVLVVDGVDLAQIVDMQNLEGLTATGRLDGYFPVTITKNGVKITKGKIVAQDQGGYIHYRPEGGTSAMEKAAIGSEFVFRIIEDLDYNSINIDVDFAENGELDMKFAIKGLSPKIDKNRPVHFNLNLQQNVLQLLRGLRYAEGLSDGIDKNVQKLFSQ